MNWCSPKSGYGSFFVCHHLECSLISSPHCIPCVRALCRISTLDSPVLEQVICWKTGGTSPCSILFIQGIWGQQYSNDSRMNLGPHWSNLYRISFSQTVWIVLFTILNLPGLTCPHAPGGDGFSVLSAWSSCSVPSALCSKSHKRRICITWRVTWEFYWDSYTVQQQRMMLTTCFDCNLSRSIWLDSPGTKMILPLCPQTQLGFSYDLHLLLLFQYTFGSLLFYLVFCWPILPHTLNELHISSIFKKGKRFSFPFPQ